jgi:hypothetical protein
MAYNALKNMQIEAYNYMYTYTFHILYITLHVACIWTYFAEVGHTKKKKKWAGLALTI